MPCRASPALIQMHLPSNGGKACVWSILSHVLHQELLEDSYFLLQMPCVLPEMSKPDSWPKNDQAGISL